MATSEVLLKYAKGSLANTLGSVVKAIQPTTGDLLYAGQRQRTRILQRTSSGQDVNQTPFAPYSDKGPVYYYPGKANKTTAGRQRAVKRLAKIIGAGKPNSKAKVTRLGIKFDNYQALKASFGRTGVDLRGISAPHMLQALVVKVAGLVSKTVGDVTAGDEPADSLMMGVYGEEAVRASGHQYGNRRLPQRRFLGVNAQDADLMLKDILTRIKMRIKRSQGEL